MRTWSAARKKTMSRVTLFVCARSGAEMEAVGRAVDAQLTPDTMVSLKYGCLSSHSSRWWWRRWSSMGVQSAATTRASTNRIGACTRGPASRVDLAVSVDRERNLFIFICDIRVWNCLRGYLSKTYPITYATSLKHLNNFYVPSARKLVFTLQVIEA